MAETKAQIVISAVNRSKAAFTEVQGQFDKINASAAAAVGRLGSLGAVIGAAFTGVSLKGAIDTLDQLDDIAEKSGIAVEQLSGLRFAGEAVGTSFEDLATGARKLAKGIGDAAGGGKQAQAAFDAIGVSIRNVDGSLRDGDQVLLDIADRFAGYKDGVGKAALAQELFGKSGETLIPLLNQGRGGIEKLRKEAEQLGAVYSGDLAKKAADFNDQLTKLSLASEAAKTRLAAELLPALIEIGDKVLELAKTDPAVQGLDKLSIAGEALATSFETVAVLVANVSFVLKSTGRELGAIAAQVSALATLDFKGFSAIGDAVSEDAKRARAELDDLDRRLLARGVRSSSSTDTKGTGDAPIVTKKDDEEKARAAAERARAEAERLFKAQLDSRLKTLQSGLDAETEAYQFQQRVLQQVFQQGNTSLKNYYAARKAAADAALQAEQKVIDQEVTALRQFQGKQSKGSDRAQTENQIQELLAKRVKLEQDASRAGVTAELERLQASAQLKGQLQEFETQLLELGGDQTGAALQRLEQQLQNVRSVTAQLGIDDGIVDRLRAVGQASIQLNDIRSKQQQITEAAALAEERYLLEADRAGKGQRETEQGLVQLRRTSLDQLQQLAARARELADANPGNADFELEAQRLANQVLKAESVIDPVLDRIKDRSSQVAQSFGEALGQFVKTGDAKGALNSLADQLENLLIQILVIEPAAEQLRQAFKGITSGSGGGGGGFLDVAGGFFKSILGSAQGNAFDQAGLVHAFAKGDVFSSPQFFRFAQGGSLANGVLGEAGPEGVLPLKRTSSGDLGVQVAGAMGQPVITCNQSFTIQGPTDRRTEQQIAAAAFRGAQRAFARNS